jgi:hypothetical protein
MRVRFLPPAHCVVIRATRSSYEQVGKSASPFDWKSAIGKSHAPVQCDLRSSLVVKGSGHIDPGFLGVARERGFESRLRNAFLLSVHLVILPVLWLTGSCEWLTS